MGDQINSGKEKDELGARIDQIERDLHRLLAATNGAPFLDRAALERTAAIDSSMRQRIHTAVHGEFPTRQYAYDPSIPLPGANAGGFTEGRARHVRSLIRQRRQRDRHFAADLFADPAWDMMLDLYAAHYEGRTVSVSSLCIAAAVPATTALRWIKTLVEEGLFVRISDPDDGRRIHVHLSEDARQRLDDYFDELGT